MTDKIVISNGPWRVSIIESERGWGSKVDEIIEFATEAEAVSYVTNYNTKHNPNLGGPVPDWYMVAETPYKV
jgi:hypothetical protein